MRIEHGAYLPQSALGTDDWRRSEVLHLARCRADITRLHPDIVLSHLSAAVVHGMWVPRIEAVHVTQPFRAGSSSRQDMLIRHHRPLRAEDVTAVDGLRVTALDRTVLDCVTMLPVDWALAAADSALRILVEPDRSRPDEAEERAESVRSRWLAQLAEFGPKRGCRQAKVLLAHADPLSESPGESRVRCLAIAEGLPPPTPQLPIETPQGRYYADFGWHLPRGSTERIAIVEFDGQEKYTIPGAMAAQESRERAILSTGARIARFVGDDLLLENRHEVSSRLRDFVPELPRDIQPVLHIRPQPARNRRRRPS